MSAERQPRDLCARGEKDSVPQAPSIVNRPPPLRLPPELPWPVYKENEQ